MAGPEPLWEGDRGSRAPWVPREPDDLHQASCLCFWKEYARFTAGCILRIACKFCQGDGKNLMQGISEWSRSSNEDDENEEQINRWSNTNVRVNVCAFFSNAALVSCRWDARDVTAMRAS